MFDLLCGELTLSLSHTHSYIHIASLTLTPILNSLISTLFSYKNTRLLILTHSLTFTHYPDSNTVASTHSFTLLSLSHTHTHTRTSNHTFFKPLSDPYNQAMRWRVRSVRLNLSCVALNARYSSLSAKVETFGR